MKITADLFEQVEFSPEHTRLHFLHYNEEIQIKNLVF